MLTFPLKTTQIDALSQKCQCGLDTARGRRCHSLVEDSAEVKGLIIKDVVGCMRTTSHVYVCITT